MNRDNRQVRVRGFTLTELLFVVLIIAILAAIALPLYFRSVERARSAEALTNMAAIRTGEQLHHVEQGTFVGAPDVPAINEQLDLKVNARDFDYEVTQADDKHFLVIATSRHPEPGSGNPLRVKMDQAGTVTYEWPGPTGGARPSGGGSGGSSGGWGGGQSGTRGGGGGSGGGTGGGVVFGPSSDPQGSVTSTTGPTTNTSGFPDATEPNIPDGPFAAVMRDAFNFLRADGALAKSLAQFLIFQQVALVFEPLACNASGCVLGTIGPEGSWYIPESGVNQVRLNSLMPAVSVPTVEISAVLAHEAVHIQQVYNKLFFPCAPSVLWLEDVEGPAYAKETLAWDSLRRDPAGSIVLQAQILTDLDDRANAFIRPDGTVDIAAHNAYITQTRGITPNTPFCS